jgi:Holliday junction DNA helicase RuvA
MIGSLKGEITYREVKRDGGAIIIVEVNGVGYELMVGARHFRSLPPSDATVELSVHTHMREGSITLFGFANRDERSFFDLLLSAHGVGPTLALSILGAMSPDELIQAFSSGDVKSLTSLPGVGLKTAQRLVLELAQRLDSLSFSAPSVGTSEASGSVRSEVSEALHVLGYATEEIRTALREVGNLSSTDELLRAALAQLAPYR